MSELRTPAPSPEHESPYLPRWMPAQFQDAKQRIRRGYAHDDYSLGETIANAVSNGVGAALAIAGLVIMLVLAVLHGGGVHVLAALAFGIPLLLAFLMSTFYHALPYDIAKQVFRILGHDFVFLFIAGAFTPFCALKLGDSLAFTVLGIEWVLAVVAIMIESIWPRRPQWLPVAFCVVMCGIGIVLVPSLVTVLPPVACWLLGIAIVLFVAGLVFYVFRKVPYLWFVSHLVVLAGSICLFLVVVLFVI